MLYLLFQINWNKVQLPFGEERLTNLLWCLGIIAGTLLIKRPASWLLSKFMATIAGQFTEKQHQALFSSLLRKPLELLLQTGLFYIAVNQLNILLNRFVLQRYKGKDHVLAIRFGDIADLLFLFFFIWFSTLLLSRIIDFVYRTQQSKAIEDNNKERQQMLPLLKDVAKLVLWTIGLFWILGAVFKVNIPALVTGLGIGGVAIALAAKESIENLFAAFTILSDKPFQTGDLIKLGNYEGNVERIGFRSTRLRSGDGSAYIIPNRKLVMENVENLSDRVRRRIKTTISIKYGLSHNNLSNITDDIQQMLASEPYVLQPVEILLNGYGENAFQLDVSYYLANPLPNNAQLSVVKQHISMNIYKIIDSYTNSAILVNNDVDMGDKNEDKEQKHPTDES